jgi:putative DNA primase/helicase
MNTEQINELAVLSIDDPGAYLARQEELKRMGSITQIRALVDRRAREITRERRQEQARAMAEAKAAARQRAEAEKQAARELKVVEEWECDLQRTQTGQPLGNLFNSVIAIRNSAEWENIYFDTRARRAFNGTKGWEDVDDIRVSNWLQSRNIQASTAIAREAVELVSRERQKDPLRDWLQSLVWDGTPRLDRWLIEVFNCKDTNYNRTIGRKWLTGAVARALQPGVKFDFALITYGAQGAGKSTVANILAGNWFTSQLADLSSKDSSQDLIGTWIIELGELDAIGRKDVKTVKAFISRQVDRYRPSYGTRTIEVPRSCVFMGTVNDPLFLSDDTGNRRFWVVEIHTALANVGWLQENRDQILAEALAAWKGGEPLQLPREMWDEAEKVTQQYRADEMWLDPISEFIANKPYVRMSEVLTSALNISAERQNKSQQMRCAIVLKSLGWKKVFNHALNAWIYAKDHPPAIELHSDQQERWERLRDDLIQNCGKTGFGQGWFLEKHPELGETPEQAFLAGRATEQKIRELCAASGRQT